MKHLALDLCCGMGGWTHGLVRAGWDVIGFDVTDWGYETETGQKLIIGDVREVSVIPGRVDREVFSPRARFRKLKSRNSFHTEHFMKKRSKSEP